MFRCWKLEKWFPLHGFIAKFYSWNCVWWHGRWFWTYDFWYLVMNKYFSWLRNNIFFDFNGLWMRFDDLISNKMRWTCKLKCKFMIRGNIIISLFKTISKISTTILNKMNLMINYLILLTIVPIFIDIFLTFINR